MKTSTDPRHQKRVQILKDLFAQSFHKQNYQTQEAREILKHADEFDAQISSSAPQWPLTKVAKVDLAILRLAAYELLLVKKQPPKVIIDEAVELAKEFGGEGSAPFVNGVLGSILKNVKSQNSNVKSRKVSSFNM